MRLVTVAGHIHRDHALRKPVGARPGAGRLLPAVGVDGDVQVAPQLRVTAEQGLPGDLGALSGTLRHDLHALGEIVTV